MKRKLGLAGSIIVVLAGAIAAHAAETMNVQGHVFSVMNDEIVIQSGKELVHLRKSALPADVRKKFETAGAHELNVTVPVSAVARIRPERPVKATPQ